MSGYSFTLDLDVDDEAELLAAARARAIEDGMAEDEASAEEFLPAGNIHDALRILLDPGRLPGCSIQDSVVEEHHNPAYGEGA